MPRRPARLGRCDWRPLTAPRWRRPPARPQLFGFDARAIDWGEYMGGTHPAGLRKFVLKKPVRE